MSGYSKYLVLLIEYEDKSFSLDLVTNLKSYAKPMDRNPPKKKPDTTPVDDTSPTYSSISVQSKLVLLTIHFPRLRIIWSSSPFATADIFADLKKGNPEPDPTKVISTGVDEDPDAAAGLNSDAEDLFCSLPRVNGKNVKVEMGKARSEGAGGDGPGEGARRIGGGEWEDMSGAYA